MNPPATSAPPQPATEGRAALSPRFVLFALVAGALLIRVPAFLARDHLGFDDGVYGVSALALRAGEVPYRDIFCPQGPLFLPLVWLADLLGFRALNAPRLLPLGAGAGVTAATWAAARQLRVPRPGPEIAAGLVATSGIVLWVTAPVTGDGPALALATAAVLGTLWWRNAPSPGRAALIGLAIGAALSVKSLVIPAIVPIGWALLGNLRHLAVAVGAATAVGLGFALAWGIADVWDQSVRYHLDGGTDATLVDNIGKLISTLADRDLPLLVAGAAVAVVAARSQRHEPGRMARSERRLWTEPSGTALVAVWLLGGLVALIVKDPLYRNHMSSLAPPAALLVGTGTGAVLARWREATLPVRTGLCAVLAVVAVYHVVHVRPILWPSEPSAAEAAARADLAALPDGAWAISDEPGYGWREGMRAPSYLVDASVTRVRQERITAPIIAEHAAEPQVCAVLVWSHRYGRFTDLGELLAAQGFSVTARYGRYPGTTDAPAGERVLYVKDGCRP